MVGSEQEKGMLWSVCGSNMCHRGKKRMERIEDKGDVERRAGNSFFFCFRKEICRQDKNFSVLQFRFINSVYLLNVAVPPLPGRVHASGAARPLWQESQSDLCGDCSRSSPTPPATTGTMQWNLRDQEKTTHSNKVCQVFLTSSCPYSLVAHLQPSQSAAILACSCQGVLLLKPSLLQDLG